MFEDHEMIDEENSLTLEQFPDGPQSLSLVLGQRRDAVAAGRVGQQIHPMNVLRTT